jgi:S-adenosylhomocysteine hydrolase
MLMYALSRTAEPQLAHLPAHLQQQALQYRVTALEAQLQHLSQTHTSALDSHQQALAALRAEAQSHADAATAARNSTGAAAGAENSPTSAEPSSTEPAAAAKRAKSGCNCTIS